MKSYNTLNGIGIQYLVQSYNDGKMTTLSLCIERIDI